MDPIADIRSLPRHVPSCMGALMMLAAVGCVRPNEDHCLFSGGDFADGETSRICVIPVDAERDALTIDPQGWYELPEGQDRKTFDTLDAAALPAGYLWVPFGLPEGLTSGSTTLRTVRGSVDAAIEDRRLDCAPTDADLRPAWGHLESYVVDTLDRKTLLRLASAAPMKDDLQKHSADLLELLAGCESSMTDTETGTSTGVDTTATETNTETATEGSTTTGDDECKGDEECSGCTPFCDLESMTCVSCNDMPDPNAACAGLNEQTPVCDGTCCVQCTEEFPDACTGVPPMCDAATNVCLPCTAHEQCGEAACNFFTGACLPEDQVVHVGPGQMYPTLTAALAAIVGPEGTMFVHADNYNNESVTIQDGEVIAFLAVELGPGIDPPLWTRSSDNIPQLTVNAGGTVLLDGMQLSGNPSTGNPGLMVDGGRAWLDRSRVVANAGGAIVVQAEGELVLHNCFVGGSVSDVDVLSVNGSSLEMVYTTAGGGGVTEGRARALVCDGAATVNARNSILVSFDPMPAVDCEGAMLTNSATEDAVGNLMGAWFVMGGYALGDFHLSAMGETTFQNIALWSHGDPLTDIDGQPRPMTDNTSDVAGADVP